MGGRERFLCGHHGNRQTGHLLLPQSPIPSRKEGAAGQRGGRPWGPVLGWGQGWESAGQEDTSMRLIIQRHTSRPKPLVLKFLTGREGSGGKRGVRGALWGREGVVEGRHKV